MIEGQFSSHPRGFRSSSLFNVFLSMLSSPSHSDILMIGALVVKNLAITRSASASFHPVQV